MKAEDTGEDIECPWCEAVGDCPHRLALIDLTFGQCVGGCAYARWNEAWQIVENGLREILRNSDPKKFQEQRGPIRQLLEFAKEDFDPDDQWISFSGVAFTQLMVEELESEGGESYPGPIVDEGGPGSSSAMALLHAESPEAVFDQTLSDLRKRLEE